MLKTLFQNLREHHIEKVGTKEADNLIPANYSEYIDLDDQAFKAEETAKATEERKRRKAEKAAQSPSKKTSSTKQKKGISTPSKVA